MGARHAISTLQQYAERGAPWAALFSKCPRHHVAAPSPAGRGACWTAIVPAWQFMKNPDVRELFNLVAWLRNV
jgi:hypothetical protein